MFGFLQAQKGRMVVGASLLAMLMLAGCSSPAAKDETASKKQFTVGIVQLVEHRALDAANKGFVDGLSAQGFKENQNITFDRQNAQADQANLQNIAQRFVANKVDLICAIATPSAQTVANATKDIPIVGTAITDYEAAKLVETNQKPGGNVTGTTDMNPIKEQVELMLAIKPDIKTIGTVYSASEVNSQLQIKILKEILAAHNIKLVEATVSTVNDIQQAAQSLIGKVDAVYVPTDNVIASAMPTLIALTNEAGLPVFCGEGALVEAGGLATVGIDYYKLGYQTGLMAARILSGKEKPATMPIEALKETKTVINETAAQKLGIKIPEDILKTAELVK